MPCLYEVLWGEISAAVHLRQQQRALGNGEMGIPFTFAKTRENKASTDWEGFLRGLRAIRCEGILNFETGPVLRSFPEELKEEALGFIASIGKYFAKALVRS